MPVEQVLHDLVGLVEVAVVCDFEHESSEALVFLFGSGFDVLGDVFLFEVGRIKLLDFHFGVHVEFGLQRFGAFGLRDAHVVEIAPLGLQHLIIKLISNPQHTHCCLQ